MRWPTSAVACALAAVAIGCKGSDTEGGTPAAAVDTAAVQPADTLATQAAPTAQPAAPAQPRQTTAQARFDEPWSPADTGTVQPGMTRDDVIAIWGAPVTERSAGDRSFLFFRNGCEVSCGTYDVVFLEGGQVVDAIVRGAGHTYGGTSSSPVGRQATPTLPGSPAGTTGAS